MKNMPMILSVLAVVMIIVLGWRVITGGPPGMKTYSFAAATVVVIIGAVVTRRGGTQTASSTGATKG